MIESVKNLYNKYNGFVKFSLVGVSNTIISLIVYWILLRFDINYLLCSTIAYMSGILNGYILSSKFVFKKSKNMNTAIRFLIVYLSSLLINLCIVYIMVNTFKMPKEIAQIPAIMVNVIYNYLVNKIWTFK